MQIIMVILHHLSLPSPTYRPLLLAGLQGYILYRHRAAECWFELVVMWKILHGYLTFELVPTSPAVSRMSG